MMSINILPGSWKKRDVNYVKSVWSGFEKLFDKKQIYQEYTKFQLNRQSIDDLNELWSKSYSSISLLVWTPALWTLPANLAVCLSNKLTYILAKMDNEFVIMAHECLKNYQSDLFQDLGTIDHMTLSGLQYEPLFSYEQSYTNCPNTFCVVFDDSVTDQKGTGCVHLAPEFGHDDYRICLENYIICTD